METKKRRAKTNIILKVLLYAGLMASIFVAFAVIAVMLDVPKDYYITLFPILFYFLLSPVWFAVSLIVMIYSIFKKDWANTKAAAVLTTVYFVLSVISCYVLYEGMSV